MTQSIDIHADFDISETSPQQFKASPKTLTMTVSLLVHGLVFFLLFYFSGFTSKSLNDPRQDDISAIKATLYFPPPPVSKPDVEPETQVTAPPDMEQNQSARPQEPEIPEADITTPEPAEPEITEPELTETASPPPEVAETEAISPELNQPTSEQSATASETPAQTSTGRLERLNRALSSHLNSMNEKKVAQMSEEASRNWQQDYYQRQTSGYQPPPEQQADTPPSINENVQYTEDMLEYGVEMSAAHQSQFKAKNVDCSTMAGKIAVSMMGISGGRVKCTEKPDFQKYIDARLKKN